MHSRRASSKTPSAMATPAKRNKPTRSASLLVNKKQHNKADKLTNSATTRLLSTTRRLTSTQPRDVKKLSGPGATMLVASTKNLALTKPSLPTAPQSAQAATMTTANTNPHFTTLGSIAQRSLFPRKQFLQTTSQRLMHTMTPPSLSLSPSPTHSPQLQFTNPSPGWGKQSLSQTTTRYPTATRTKPLQQHNEQLHPTAAPASSPTSTLTVSPHSNHHTRRPGFNPEDIQQRVRQRLKQDLDTTMPVFKKQLASFTDQLVAKYGHKGQSIPASPPIFNSDGSINTQHLPRAAQQSTRSRPTTATTTTTTSRRHLSSATKHSTQRSRRTQTAAKRTIGTSHRDPHHHQHHHQQDYGQYTQQQKTAFQRLLPHINKVSQVLGPRIRKLASMVKSGVITLTGPMAKLISAHLVPPVMNTVDRIAGRGEGLLLWVDKQIAKRKDIPVDQISAIRTQVIAITANSIVAVSKAVAAYVSNSGVMLAEALHSLADLSNQALLLFGTTKALRDSDDIHPYGYATAKYIYGVLSASGVFFISCALTMYHAITQFFDDTHAVDVTPLTVIVLGLSLVVEGYSQYAAFKSIKELAAKDEMTFMEYIRNGRETTSIAIFVEDSVAIIGLTIAIVTTALTHFYQNNIFDTIGTGCIGLAMGFVAFFLFHRNESYVLGTSFSEEEKAEILSALKTRDAVTAVHDLKAVAYGESDCRVKAEVVFDGQIIARQVLDQTKLIPVSVLVMENHDDNGPVTQQMMIGPDGTLAGNQILNHLTKNAGLSTDDATQLLLRFGGECVSEVARETDQVEKYTKALFPEVTHLDLECHSSNPLEDFSSEHFVYPYLTKHRKAKEMVASAKRAKKSRAWTNFAKTNFQSLQQAMRGEHHLFLQQQAQQQHLAPHPHNSSHLNTQSLAAAAAAASGIPSTQQQLQSRAQATNKHAPLHNATPPSPSSQQPHSSTSPTQHHRPPIHISTVHPSGPAHSHALDELTRDLDLNGRPLPSSQIFHNAALENGKSNNFRTGRYDKPIHAKELVRDDVYKEALSSYRNMFGEIDSSMTLFPVEAYNHLHMNTGKPVQPTITSTAAPITTPTTTSTTTSPPPSPPQH